MSSPIQILQAQIAQIKSSGDIAPPNTWISSSSIIKNGKKYTYYRLMKAEPTLSANGDSDNSKKPKVRGKMVKYLGSGDSAAYKEMKQAIARRNQIQVLLRKLSTLEKQVSAGQPKKKTKQPTLTTLVIDLMVQVQQLQTDLNSVKLELVKQQTTPLHL